MNNTIQELCHYDIDMLLSVASTLTLEDLWKLMDDVWDEIGCNSRKINIDKLNLFYKHPVWLVNGFFIEQDDLSLKHRRVIADWIQSKGSEIESVIDYGGGFGTLARMIADNNQLIVDIYEPYPNSFAVAKAEMFSNIQFVSNIGRKYDCLVSTDVLEHVSDPLHLFSEMVGSVKPGGYLIIANYFYPVIKCHLPTTFHLRYTFNVFAKFMGLKVVGQCNGSNAFLYKKLVDKKVSWRTLRILEQISRLLFVPLRIAHLCYRFFKKVFK